MSKIYLIGAGPGDPELLTLKAVNAIKESDAILYDHLINPETLRYCKDSAELLLVGKMKGDRTMPQEEINSLIVQMAKKYPVVSRLKGGDPFIFGRGGEEYEYCLENGFDDVTIIPGITAALGSAASLGMPLTHRDYSSEVTFITGHRKVDDDYSAFDSIVLKNKTFVVYMAVSALGEITGEMLKNPENSDIPVAIVEKATRHNQRMVRGTVSTIADIVKKENVKAPALMIVGDVINFLNKTEELKNKIKHG